MSRIRLAFGWAAALFFYLWSGGIKILDWVGRSTILEDWQNLMGETMPSILNFLLSAPWWAPAICAPILTAWMIWLTWPRVFPFGQSGRNGSGVISSPLPSQEVRPGIEIEADTSLIEFVRIKLQSNNLTDHRIHSKIGPLLDEVRQQAVFGKLTVWGRKNCDQEMAEIKMRPLVEISKLHWENNKINEYEFAMEEWSRTIRDDKEYDDDYSDLHISLSQANRVLS